MFPSNSYSDLHLQYADKTPVNGRSSSPFSPRLCGLDLDDELILEQLLFQEEQVIEDNNGGDINLTGSCNTSLESTDGVDLAVLPVSPDRSLHPKARPSQKVRSKVAGSKKLQLMPRKRTGKKDRHSKIRTAQGLRDRRIRLSVHIARKFFDLQEMLGLDKASKTIEWLLAESQDAIDELSKKNCSDMNMDSTPESLMVFEIKETEDDEEGEEEVKGRGESENRKVSKAQNNCMNRDSGDKARASSREKLMMKGLNSEGLGQVHQEGNPNCISLDGFFLDQPESGRDSHQFDASEMNYLSIIEKFLGITSMATKPSSFPDSSSGNDCYRMIGGVNLLEGNVQILVSSYKSSFFMPFNAVPQRTLIRFY